MKKLFETKNLSTQQIESILKQESYKHSALNKINLTKEKASEESRKQDLQYMKNFFGDIESIVCVGCRDESELQTFLKSNIDAKGIDINQNNSKLIKQEDAANIENCFANQKFDIVYSRHSLEHIINPEAFLNGASNISKKGVFIVLPPGTAPRPGHPTHFDIMKEIINKDENSNDMSKIKDILVLLNKEAKKVKLITKPQNINTQKKEIVIMIRFWYEKSFYNRLK